MPTPVVGTPHVGLQSTLSFGVTVSGTTAYTVITGMETIDGPEASIGVVEVSPLGATYKGKLPSISDPGEVTFTVYYDGTDTTHQFLTGLLGTTTQLPWKVDYPDGTSAEFTGFLSGFGIKGMEAESPVTGDGTITINGAITFSTSP